MTPEPNPEQRAAVSIAEDHVSLPPRASLMIMIYYEDASPDVNVIVESDQRWLLDRGVFTTRSIARFKQRQSHVLFTNFTEEYQHLNKGTAIAFLEETQAASDEIAVADLQRASGDTLELPHSFDVNPALLQEKQNKLLDLLPRYSECFS